MSVAEAKLVRWRVRHQLIQFALTDLRTTETVDTSDTTVLRLAVGLVLGIIGIIGFVVPNSVNIRKSKEHDQEFKSGNTTVTHGSRTHKSSKRTSQGLPTWKTFNAMVWHR